MRMRMMTAAMTVAAAMAMTAMVGCEDKAAKAPDPATSGGSGVTTPPADPIGEEAARIAEERAAKERAAEESKETGEQNETTTPGTPGTPEPGAGETDAAKQEAVGEAEKKVSWFRQKLDAMKAKSSEAAAAADEKWDAAAAKAEQSYDAAKAKLAQVKEASGEAWAAAKPELDEAVTQLNEAYEKAAAAWSAKLNPPAEAKPGEAKGPIEPTK